MNNTTHAIAAKFNTTLEKIINLEKSAPKSIIDTYKAGDVIACWAGYPNRVLRIIELKKDNPEIDNIDDYTTDKSHVLDTSHLASAEWFKIN